MMENNPFANGEANRQRVADPREADPLNTKRKPESRPPTGANVRSEAQTPRTIEPDRIRPVEARSDSAATRLGGNGDQQSGGSGPPEQGRSVRATIGQKAKEASNQAVRATEELKESSAQYADSGRQQLSQRVRQLQTLCSEAQRALEENDEHVLASAGGFLGEQVGRAASYIEARDARQMAQDVGRIASRNPGAVVGIGLTLGFVLGRIAMASDERSRSPMPQRGSYAHG